MSESRTSKSLKNAEVSVFFYALNIIIGFWKRKVFYDYLGSEILGLDTTASTILAFLNLAELGVGASVAYFLYRPMYESDTLTMNKIVALQGWIYRRIAFFIIMASLILMGFFPIIFAKIQIPLWYAYTTFGVMLFSSMLGYFMNYRMCILNADQKGYKVTKITSVASVIFQILLIFLLPIVSHPYLFYIGTTLAGSLFGCYWLNRTINKEYPWLTKVEQSGRELLKEYPEILKKTKQIFVHKITTVIVNQAAPLVMFAFTSLTVIAYYGNYLATIDKGKDLLKTAFQSTAAGVGNLIASGNNERIQSVFWEMTDSRMCISFACVLILSFITEPFISVWLSPDYLLGPSVLILVSVLSWLSINRSTTDNFIGGYGLFQDIWAPIIEAIINLGFAILLGSFYGISGVLMGTLISTLIIIYGWKPYFLYTRGFKLPVLTQYFLPMLWRWGILLSNAIVFIYINEHLKPQAFTTYMDIAIYGLILSVVILPIVYLEGYCLMPGVRVFHRRIYSLVKNRFKQK